MSDKIKMLDSERAVAPSPTPVDVSVVVVSFNRADMLAKTLASLAKLDTTSGFTYEIVVVDNASTDHTPAVIATAEPGAAVAVRAFCETEPGVSFGRNRGIAEATGQWIAFHDDDQLADPQWIHFLLELAHRRNLKCVGGAVKLLLPEDNQRELAAECRQILGEKVGMEVEQPYTRKRIPGTNNILIHRSILEDVGVFDTALTIGGEDADLYRRMRAAGYEAWFTPRSFVYHVIPEKRMAEEYMRWTATRHGRIVALRERRDWGATAAPIVAVARFCQAAIKYFPRYAIFKILGKREDALGARCLLWRSGGYLHQATEMILGTAAKENANHATLDFRKGREQLMGATSPANTSTNSTTAEPKVSSAAVPSINDVGQANVDTIAGDETSAKSTLVATGD